MTAQRLGNLARPHQRLIKPLGRGEKELDLLVTQRLVTLALIGRREVAVDKSRRYLTPRQVGDLLAHQRLEGRDDIGGAWGQQGGQLEAERFAGAGGADQEDRFTAQRGQDNLKLTLAQRAHAQAAHGPAEVARHGRNLATNVEPVRHAHGHAFEDGQRRGCRACVHPGRRREKQALASKLNTAPSHCKTVPAALCPTHAARAASPAAAAHSS